MKRPKTHLHPGVARLFCVLASGPARALTLTAICILLSGLVLAPATVLAAPIHTTYLWHMHQPIYWPDRSTWYPSRYETAYETITLGHSQSDVYEIFNKDDRVHDYQNYPKDAVASVLDLPDAGAQMSFAAALIENIKSLADAGWNGGRYAGTWYADYRTGRSWTTSGGRSRLSQLLVAAHHPIAPLMDQNALRKEIQVQKIAYKAAWGDTNYSKGYFPAEICFSERMIPILVQQGMEWVIVPDVHVSRACQDYPYVASEDNCDPPNPADQLNPAQGYYDNIRISRGVNVKTPVPFGFRPHYARYVDPSTGQAYSIKVIPSADAMSWNEGYGMYGTGEIDAIASRNDPAKPMLILFAHDGDNSWSGGYSYYNENVTNFCHQAATKGYEPSTVDEYLADHPVDPGDVVHVEDGGWVNADGDFGSPQFINWNWPLVDASGQFDIPDGWAEDERNWAVLTAAQNRVETAEAIFGTEPSPAKIYDPTTGANSVEKAWHHLLSGYESGYMYYGTSLDMEVKATLAANAAVLYADPVITGGGGADAVAPTIWLPQRLPWNPGGRGGGSLWGYPSGEGTQMASDFWIWTFVYDASGVKRVQLKYRLDADGTNPMTSDQNETYAGGAEVGSWQTLAMAWRDFPKGNYLNDPSINFSVLPDYIADEYYVHVTELSEVLIDYYVEAEDSLGNVKRSPIQHVWIGETSGSPSHVIDGSLDTTSTLVASNGSLHLYADWDGQYLYVATEGVGSTAGWDHFVILGVDLSTPVAAPWAKAGTVADRTLYLGNEDSNNWCGWFDENENVLSSGIEKASGSYLEGLVALETYLGTPLPGGVYLAMAAYQSADGGVLAAQVPAGNGNGNVEAAEYVYFPLAVTGVEPDQGSGGSASPQAAVSLSVRPNPSSSGAQFELFLQRPQKLLFDIYDIHGHKVRTLDGGLVSAGRQSLAWDGRDARGQEVSPGVYIIRIDAAGQALSKKIVVLR
ncbi:MAG: T9SS type A sorting domain-containing protein [Candidatus Eisenbacteria bacterium]|nr:T9SS type A sorting domain-containing protein [Candidatus Eisenbacteria bacterium]